MERMNTTLQGIQNGTITSISNCQSFTPVNSSPVNAQRNSQADIILLQAQRSPLLLLLGISFDPGGPGGTDSDGDPGNYPNCGCVTTTTLTGVDEIEVLYMSIFTPFDWIRIYDGRIQQVEIFENETASGTYRETDFVNDYGSAIITSTSGSLTFEFDASAVVNRGGWEMEVLSTGGGGGGGGGGCTAGSFSDRPSFEAAFSGTLNFEDFAGGPGGISACDGPVSSAGNSCFAPVRFWMASNCQQRSCQPGPDCLC